MLTSGGTSPPKQDAHLQTVVEVLQSIKASEMTPMLQRIYASDGGSELLDVLMKYLWVSTPFPPPPLVSRFLLFLPPFPTSIFSPSPSSPPHHDDPIRGGANGLITRAVVVAPPSQVQGYGVLERPSLAHQGDAPGHGGVQPDRGPARRGQRVGRRGHERAAELA